MKLNIWLIGLLGSLALFVSSPAWSDDAIDVNAATVEELQSVKGIGPKTAAAIVEHRKMHGKFKSVDELTEVKGIGGKKLKKIKKKVRVGKAKAKAEKKKRMKEKMKKERMEKNKERD